MTGTGTINDPFVITTLQDLWDIRLNMAAIYVMGNDLDASDTSSGAGDQPWNTAEGWIPIGYPHDVDNFGGMLNGQGYTISNLYRNGQFNGGLFSAIITGFVLNLNFANPDITVVKSGSGSGATGVLASYITGGAVENCHVVGGSVQLNGPAVGGLIGRLNQHDTADFPDISIFPPEYGFQNIDATGPYLYRCSSSATVTGAESIGGLVGELSTNYDSRDMLEIRQCAASGMVTGEANTGGLIGKLGYHSHVMESKATGDVTVQDMAAGTGMVGTSAGGLIGTSTQNGTTLELPTISDCYATGNVTATVDLATGISGNIPTVERCFFAGTLTIGDGPYQIAEPIAGYPAQFGIPAPVTTDTYWDIDTTGLSTSYSDAVGKTTAEMQTQGTFPAWDFGSVWAMDSYPELQWDYTAPPPTGKPAPSGAILPPYKAIVTMPETRDFTPEGADISGNIITLPSVPYIPYQNYQWSTLTWDALPPVALVIDGTVAEDITPYHNMRITPFLNSYNPPLVGLQFYVRQNQMITNHPDVGSLGTIQISYLTMADSVNLSAAMVRTDTQLPEVDNYQVKMHVQAY